MVAGSLQISTILVSGSCHVQIMMMMIVLIPATMYVLAVSMIKSL